ncbi:hypothetical protein [Acidovorax sp. SUPP3334]|uniref:hypothetical protein n=1 Tax=Acidovorax sp. SUPP3334 TaxID=2920881 RepID=UPI0023DE1AE7|nr:hypothetical protein [Acidovorax sp. SUPP3334]GKT20724.1 hypothetical protein AVHM3334_02150 [Acidovorax sp. SUPP3334]
MATPNYGYEKRQRELAKKKKKEEKAQAKTHRKDDPREGFSQDGGQPGAPPADGNGGPGPAA